MEIKMSEINDPTRSDDQEPQAAGVVPPDAGPIWINGE
jgi:hypothetical protein